MSVRTRFAPSPTGYMHIGGMRTAFFCWLFARHNGGQFILRIDDTDQARNVETALGPILRAFKWLGLTWDEGPEVGGPYAPYFQSQRGDLYRAAADRLLAEGKAYRDFSTKEEIDADRKQAEREKRPYVNIRRSLDMSGADRQRLLAEGRAWVLRFQIPRDRKIVLNDLIRGTVEWDAALLPDPVICRADGSPLYNFATVVDDMQMQITHVIRAEEHLSNTPIQLLIHEALGNPLPEFAHVPYVAAPGSKEKLSKRKIDQYRKNPQFQKLFQRGDEVFSRIGLAPVAVPEGGTAGLSSSGPGATGGSSASAEPAAAPTGSKLPVAPVSLDPVMVEYYEKIGYLPAAVLNALGRIGWSLDDHTEIMSLDTMIQNFMLDRVVQAPASLDPDKLFSFQSHWMKELPLDQKVDGCLPYLVAAKLVTQENSAPVQASGGREAPGTGGDASGEPGALRPPLAGTVAPEVRDVVTRIVTAMGDRLKIFADILDAGFFFTDAIEYDEKNFEKRVRKPGVPDHLRSFRQRLSGLADWSPASLEAALHSYCTETGEPTGTLVHALRLSTTGQAVGPGLYDCLSLLGRDKVLARIDAALQRV